MPPKRRSACSMRPRFQRNCAGYAKCCTWQPPQVPKTVQNGSARSAELRRISTSSATAYLAFTDSMRTRARSPGTGPRTYTTMPSARPTAWPVLAMRSLHSMSTRSPAVTPLGGFFVIELLEQPVRFIDERLNALGRRILRRTSHRHSHHGVRQARRHGCDSHKPEDALEGAVAARLRLASVPACLCRRRVAVVRVRFRTRFVCHTSVFRVRVTRFLRT